LPLSRPSGSRDIREALAHENLGVLCANAGDVAGMHAHLRVALQLLSCSRVLVDGVHGDTPAGRAAQRARVLRTLQNGGSSSAAGTAADVTQAGKGGASCSRAARLRLVESDWNSTRLTMSTFDAAGMCHHALPLCDTRAEQRRWLLRALALPGASGLLKAAATRGCRACGESKQQPLKSCAACGRVAYCGGACQKADWRRHKRVCTAAASNAADAALADAQCAVCARPLLAEDGDADGATAVSAPASADAVLEDEQRVELPRCRHLAHAACRAACGRCPACGAA
jgi:hypothetical protein